MAKVKRWAMRAADGDYYLFDSVEPPRKRVNHPWAVGLTTTACVFSLSQNAFERIFPVVLPPGGGPVLIEFKDEE